ncbi:MAG TPA: c-type cytochrome [Longimicrobium sp.]|nr:c-type cytochrome [Longimicrobium sp.]
MLLAVTTTGKIVLALAAGAFIVFAILSSFVLPRRDPDYPGKRLGAFVALTLVLFAVLIGSMVAFAGESEEAGHAGAEAESTQPPGTATETTGGDTGETPTGTGGEGGEGGEAQGDAAAGEEVFAANGCGSCHALEAAGASGAVGPDLDESQPSFELAVDRVTNGSGAMPAFGDSLDEQQIRDVAAYVVESTQ